MNGKAIIHIRNATEFLLENDTKGTTCIAAERCGRKFIGIELDNSYYDMAKTRITEELATNKSLIDFD